MKHFNMQQQTENTSPGTDFIMVPKVCIPLQPRMKCCDAKTVVLRFKARVGTDTLVEK